MRRIPRVLLGTSPFIGAAQFGRKSHEYRMKFFYNEENMKELFVKSAEFGVKAVQLIAYEPLVRALKRAEDETGDDFFVVATIPTKFERSLKMLESIQPEIIAIHADFCDALDERIGEWARKIREAGASPAAATHIPGDTIPEIDALEFDFEYYLAPLNPVGYAMFPDFESTLRALERTDKGIIAIKPLAAGNLKPTKEIFDFIFQYADAVSVGITSEDEMKETYKAVSRSKARRRRV